MYITYPAFLKSKKRAARLLLFIIVLPFILALLSGVAFAADERIVLDPPPTLVGGVDIIECPTCGAILGTQEHIWKVSGDGTNPNTPDGYTYTYDYTRRGVSPCLKCSKTQPKTGAWVLKEINIHWRRDGEGWITRPEGDILETSYNGGTYGSGSRDTHTIRFENNQLTIEGHYKVVKAPGRPAESVELVYDASMIITASGAPSYVAPGDLIEIEASGQRTAQIIKTSNQYSDGWPGGSVCAYFSINPKGNPWGDSFQAENKRVMDNYDNAVLIGSSFPENSATLRANAPEHSDSDSDLYLILRYDVSPSPSSPWVYVYREYHYVWSDDAATPAASVSPSTSEPSGPVTQIVDSGPKDSAGEDVTDIKTAAILGVSATIAAIAGAGAAVAGGSSGTGAANPAMQKTAEESARQKTGDFRMVVYKSFGDTIIYGKTDQYVMARIECKNEQTGVWGFDSARSNAISITVSSVEGLGLYPPPLHPAAPGKGNTLMLANENPTQAQATLSFKFSAPDGGSFKRSMTFKLSGAPSIRLAANKVWFLEGDYAPFELKCKLIGYDPAKYNICLDGMESFVTLEFVKDVKGDYIKVAPAPGVFDIWNKQAFIYSYPCYIAYEDKDTLDRIAKAEFTVNLCYEGIGLAMSSPNKTTKIDELPEPMELYTFSEAEQYRRTESMVRLALTVACWDDKKRMLQYDTAAAKTLELAYTVDLTSDQLKTSSAKTDAMRALKDAGIKTACIDNLRGKDITYQADMKPAFFVTATTRETESGLAPFPILLTISLPSGKYPPLVLKGTFNPLCDWEKVVRWFFEFPGGTFAARQMKVGNPDLYVSALAFIENRVYSFKNVPFGTTTDQNHYEDGVIAATTHKRVRSVVLRESDIPTGIGDYKKAQSLVHELTHALEHKNMGSVWTLVAASAGHERHSYFLQYASDAIYELAQAERGIETETNVISAIDSMYKVYYNKNNTPEPRRLSWFGAQIPTQHELFNAYIDEWMQIGTGTAAGNVGEAISRNYFPGALKNANKRYPAAFEVQSGKLKGAKFIILWTDGRLRGLGVWHKLYRFEVKSPLRWIGGLTLRTKLEVIDKLTLGGAGTGTAQRGRDTFTVTLTALETLKAGSPEFTSISGFSAVWQLEGGSDKNSVVSPDLQDGKMTTSLIKIENTSLRIYDINS